MEKKEVKGDVVLAVELCNVNKKMIHEWEIVCTLKRNERDKDSQRRMIKRNESCGVTHHIAIGWCLLEWWNHQIIFDLQKCLYPPINTTQRTVEYAIKINWYLFNEYSYSVCNNFKMMNRQIGATTETAVNTIHHVLCNCRRMERLNLLRETYMNAEWHKKKNRKSIFVFAMQKIEWKINSTPN